MKMFETKRTTHFELIRHSMDVKLGLPKLPDEIIAEKWHPEFFNEVGRMLVRDGIPETWVEDWPEFKQYMKNRLIFGEYRYGDRCPTNCSNKFSNYHNYIFELHSQNSRKSASERSLEYLIDQANCFYLIWCTHGSSFTYRAILNLFCHYRFSKKYKKRKMVTNHNRPEEGRLKRR